MRFLLKGDCPHFDKPRKSGEFSASSRLQETQGRLERWRIRLGDYRVVYEIDDTAKTVTVTRVAQRREVYD